MDPIFPLGLYRDKHPFSGIPDAHAAPAVGPRAMDRFETCLTDGLFLSALTLVTGGYDSFLYWLFLARNCS